MTSLYHLLPTWLHLTLEAIGAFWVILALAIVVLILIYARKVSGEDDGAERDAERTDDEPWVQCPDCHWFYDGVGMESLDRPKQSLIPHQRCQMCQRIEENRIKQSTSHKLEASFKGE